MKSHDERKSDQNFERNMKTSHLFDDPIFWKHFQTEVKSKSWSCNFSSNILLSTLDNDVKFYSDDIILRKRRQGALRWVTNTEEWVTLVLNASREVAHQEIGVYSQKLRNLHMLEAFVDFVNHLHYFQKVADLMTARGHPVNPLSQDSAGIHDIDKLDPIMMVAYSERFEDNVATSLWDLCVDRHTRVNPHHQAHCMWRESCKENIYCNFCQEIKIRALREMVCDKVSRRVQKSLGGRMSDDMWDVELNFYSGLPEEWLGKASEMMRNLKESNAIIV